jgi:hypothetical protein
VAYGYQRPHLDTMDSEITAVLESVPFFRGLSRETLERVGERMVRREVPGGWSLFRSGDPPRGLFILAKGRVEIFRSSPEGREQVIHTELPVRSIAELPLFDGEDYPASARTGEPSELFFSLEGGLPATLSPASQYQRRRHPGIGSAGSRAGTAGGPPLSQGRTCQGGCGAP